MTAAPLTPEARAREIARLRKRAAELRSTGNDMHLDSASMSGAEAAEVRHAGIERMRAAERLFAQADRLEAAAATEKNDE